MRRMSGTLARQWQDGVNLLLAIWLLVSPWVLGFTMAQAAFYNTLALAVIIGVLAIAALVAFQEWEEWVGLALGLWLAIAPWALGFAGIAAATYNSVIVGLLVAALAGWSIWRSRQDAHQAA
jgi:hypothetical protein